MKKKATIVAILVVFLVLLLDQSLKIWVKTNMHLGEEIHLIGNSAMLHFTENPGMAFGMELGGSWGKPALTIFRFLACIAMSIYLHRMIKAGANLLFVVCISLIIAGAAGNLIDSAFYGLIFSDSLFQTASMFPEGGGYGKFLYGYVVDMFYCPVIRDSAGKTLFFKPVFNVADSSITVAVAIMIVFYRKVFRESLKKPVIAETTEESSNEQPTSPQI
ncbi:MAG TPA: lipoprotein signal peptidase [Bacteroidales bacterium]|nr:lipoprotein signal peptidase [Bacteroidales bacterium]HOE03638.1 lipoprotein signal peptidase [Bacteroidales bacterium]HQL70967.1 lipoprotein signal peptidase [Bacteroidales bacterium]